MRIDESERGGFWSIRTESAGDVRLLKCILSGCFSVASIREVGAHEEFEGFIEVDLYERNLESVAVVPPASGGKP